MAAWLHRTLDLHTCVCVAYLRGYALTSLLCLCIPVCVRARFYSGELLHADFTETAIFNLRVPKQCSGVPAEILLPETQWKDRGLFYTQLQDLARQFMRNFNTFLDGDRYVGPEMVGRILKGGPLLEALDD